MNILDENIIKNQCQWLKSWRISFHQIGYDIGKEGIQDENIISLLHDLQRPTFFTRDGDFFNRNLCHPNYCLAYLSVKKEESAFFIRRFLSHPHFSTYKKRIGCVVKVSYSGISVWRLNIENLVFHSWQSKIF